LADASSEINVEDNTPLYYHDGSWEKLVGITALSTDGTLVVGEEIHAIMVEKSLVPSPLFLS